LIITAGRQGWQLCWSEPWTRFSARTPSGEVVGPVAVYLRDLQAAGRTAATQRSYGMDLLRWFRFCWVIGVPWDQATRCEARDFCQWIQIAAKPVSHRWRAERSDAAGDTAGAQGGESGDRGTSAAPSVSTVLV
jgi:hypothetical protein